MIPIVPIDVVMTKDVFILDAQDNIVDAELLFGNHNIRHAPVVSRGQLVGMLSLVDVTRKLGGMLPEPSPIGVRELKVRHLMTPDPVSVTTDTPFRDVARLFTENDFHAIPVQEGNRVVGIVTTTDIIRFMLDMMDEAEGDE